MIYYNIVTKLRANASRVSTVVSVVARGHSSSMTNETDSHSPSALSGGPKHVIGVVGWSGNGKTTLLNKLIPALNARGLSVSTMKHTHHNFDMDHPGKDSYQHREAGAEQVLLTSSKRWALLHELRGEPEPDMDALIKMMAPVDVLLIEGFKAHRYPKIEVHRPAAGKQLICETDDSIVALACDEALQGLAIPILDLNDVEAVADFMVDYLEINT